MANGGTHVLQHLASTLAFGDFSARHTVPDPYKLSVDVLHAGGDSTTNGLLDLFLDEASSERPESLVQKVVLRVSDGESESIDFHDNALDFEHGSFVLVGGHEVDGSLQPPSSAPSQHIEDSEKLTVRPSPPKTTSANPESIILIPVFFLK
jgi:hypothetical protein